MIGEIYHKHEPLLFDHENCEYELGALIVRSSTAQNKAQIIAQKFPYSTGGTSRGPYF